MLCREISISALHLNLARRRGWIEHTFRPLKHLLTTESYEVPTAGAYFGHLILHILANLVLFSTSRIVLKGGKTMEKSVFSLKHHWRFLDSEQLIIWNYKGFHGVSARRSYEW